MYVKKTILRAYARLIAVTGVRVQKGQNIIITAELDQPEFVTMLVEECYRAGAGKVTVDWNHQPLEKLHVRHRSVKTLSMLEPWEVAKLQHQVDTLPGRIYLVSEDPDGLRGMNQEKRAKGMQARYKIIKPYRDKMEGRYQWCIAAVPGAAWAKKVFPNETKSRAIEKLWEAILHTCRMDSGDGVKAWEAHNKDLEARCAYLNSLGIETLEYHASNGTDLRVGMIPEARFCGGGEHTIGGAFFNPNLPTEECFISPKRGEAEGIVYSSKPLSYNGELIENFSIRFERGKAVKVHAEKNEALLKKLLPLQWALGIIPLPIALLWRTFPPLFAPLSWVMTALVLLPVVLVAAFPRCFSVDLLLGLRRKGSAPWRKTADLSMPLGVSGYLLMMAALVDYPICNYAWAAVLVLAVGFAAALWMTRPLRRLGLPRLRLRRALLTLVLAVTLSGAVLELNDLLDLHPVEYRQAVVTDKRESTGRCGSYLLYLRGEDAPRSVSRAEYESVEPGNSVILEEHPGAFGIRYSFLWTMQDWYGA